MHALTDRKQLTVQSNWPGTAIAKVAGRLSLHDRGSHAHEVNILRLEPNARLPTVTEGWGVEVIVLEGSWELPEGTLEKHGYSRRPPQQVDAGRTTGGCTLYVRASPFAPTDNAIVHLQSSERPWLAGHGDLRIQSLHSAEKGGAALVLWPAGERFVPHQHWGGEEIFVLFGTFQDEHGSYPMGTWIQSPHLSTHFPFVEEETLIFVKTGHLLDGEE